MKIADNSDPTSGENPVLARYMNSSTKGEFLRKSQSKLITTSSGLVGKNPSIVIDQAAPISSNILEKIRMANKTKQGA
jgi:hypothetical protein